MTPEDVLPNIAEIAISLAGFGGLVAAFGQRPGQFWRGDQKTRIVLLVILSFAMIVSALYPSAMSGLSHSPALVWGVPMVSFGGLSLALLTYWIIVARRHGYKLQFPLVSIPVITAAGLLQCLLLLSGCGVLLPFSPALFVLGLLSILVFGAVMFLALLHITWRE